MCTTCGCGDTTGAVVSGPAVEGEPAPTGGAGQGVVHAHPYPDAVSPGAVQEAGGMVLRKHPADDHAGHAAALLHAPMHPRAVHYHDHPHGHAHAHPHERAHEHAHEHAHIHGTSVVIEQDILAKNQWIAQRNRGWLAGRSIVALNLVSSPGAGKTTLLERTIRDLGPTLPLTVIEGDQATLNDAQRIRAAGCRAIQVNTGTGCHLDADMISRALTALDPPPHSVVMIENVGNLICPALFDLGEQAKVVILSVTEGEDKPLKYPHMFRASSLMLMTKTDLLPYVSFDVARCLACARQVNPDIAILQVSALSGAGMDDWYLWLRTAFGGRTAPPEDAVPA